MPRYLLNLSYDGTPYHGWQVQPNVSTVQGTIEKTLKSIFFNSIRVQGASRTDKGVHARNQFAYFFLKLDLDLDKLKNTLNGRLPKSINVNSIININREFSFKLIKKKTYRYYFSDEYYIENYQYSLRYELTKEKIKLIQEILPLFLGTHDFCNYYCSGMNYLSTVRTIHEIKFEKNYIEITGDGFLKQMIRLIVGHILDYIDKKITYSSFEKYLSEEKKERQFKIAPPHGLILEKIYLPVPSSN